MKFFNQRENYFNSENFPDYIIVQLYTNVSLINHTDLLDADSSYFGDDFNFQKKKKYAKASPV